jgi:hypothetical protein
MKEMENTYLVCFDFNKTRERFNPDNEYNEEFAVEFMGACYLLKDKLIELFPNFVIPISNNSFLIKSLLNIDQLLELLLKKLSVQGIGIQEGDTLENQIYVAKINSFESHTLKKKQLEIAYLANLSCKHN